MSTSPPFLQIHKAARRFGRRWALAGVDLSIQQGEGVLLTGPNGSGKSTLLRCLATTLKLHHGQITYQGLDLWKERSRIRPDVAVLMHDAQVWEDLSAVENLEVWARLGGLDVGIPAIVERVGLDPKRSDPVRTFSAGMRRRLALARVLLKKPKLVLMDEPYSALDVTGRALVTEVAQQLRANGATLVLASHLPDEATACCDRFVQLEDGRLVGNT